MTQNSEQSEQMEEPLEQVPESTDDFAEPTEFVAEIVEDSSPASDNPDDMLKAVVEAVIYITDEPLTAEQIAGAIEQPVEKIQEVLSRLVTEYSQPDRGLTVRELAGGYKMGTKPEHHDFIRQFVHNLQPPLKLSLPALETLAVVAYKQPITAPEIMEIRGVQGTGVLKTLLDRKLIATAGRKDVIGKPIMYKTTKDFLVQFGLSSLKELPTLKEFEELGRLALTDESIDESAAPVDPGEQTLPAAAEEAQTAPVEPAASGDEETETKADG
ncbi:MAG TPA: SMC-Scp complex subunit ScpB [Bryobacteraceae bacterium]|nr:SMC-Scp complex subunit ScpB [Bryobacteraceae bacterium]